MIARHMRVVCVGIAGASLIVLAGEVSAQTYRYEGLHPDWYWAPGADGSRFDDCPGHCGGGCGSSFAPCGDRHEWVRRVDGPLRSSTFANQMECRANDDGFVPPDWPGGYVDGEIHSFTATRYTAAGTWTFEGQEHSLCIEHDEACRSAGGCAVPKAWPGHVKAAWWLLIGCSATPRDWGPYSETFYRWQFTSPRSTGRACQVWVGSRTG